MSLTRHHVAVAAIYLLLLIGGWVIGQWLFEFLDGHSSPFDNTVSNIMVLSSAAVFIITSALPFVPGAEIGFGMMLMFGGNMALIVYPCMVAALLLAFLVGRFIPPVMVANAFARLGLNRANLIVLELIPLSPDDRLARLIENAPRRIIPQLLRHRYLALIFLFNLPGNSIVGGGGGIALTAGLSGVFTLPLFFAVLVIAVAPVPLLFLIFG